MYLLEPNQIPSAVLVVTSTNVNYWYDLWPYKWNTKLSGLADHERGLALNEPQSWPGDQDLVSTKVSEEKHLLIRLPSELVFPPAPSRENSLFISPLSRSDISAWFSDILSILKHKQFSKGALLSFFHCPVIMQPDTIFGGMFIYCGRSVDYHLSPQMKS